ncbi:MAG: pseudouridine synthase [Bacteroidota bacterium]
MEKNQPERRSSGRKKPRNLKSKFSRPTRGRRPFSPDSRKGKPRKEEQTEEEEVIRLNRFIAHAGIASRREADELIKAGLIKVNGAVVTTLGTKVQPAVDKVFFRDQEIQPESHIYLLFNKPKNVISTSKDPRGRRTIIGIIQPHISQRVFPVGRLDRNTTGLILLTNDGELAKKLTHPSYNVRKLYHVTLDKDVPEDHLMELLKGVELEDGLAKADKIDYVTGAANNEIGIEIHMGKNRIVRRMFEHFGYQIMGLDRVAIGHLTKKNLPRGRWRELNRKEVDFLKMI